MALAMKALPEIKSLIRLRINGSKVLTRPEIDLHKNPSRISQMSKPILGRDILARPDFAHFDHNWLRSVGVDPGRF